MNTTDHKTIFNNYLVLLECHNEQKRHIRDFFRNRNLRTLEYPMFTADYSFMIMPNKITMNAEPLYFGNKFLIERKSGHPNYGGGFGELKGNLSSGHAEFKAEFQRMTNVKDVILLIENATGFASLDYCEERGKFTNEIYKKSLSTFLQNRNKERAEVGSNEIQIVFTSEIDSGETVAKLIYKYMQQNY
jgi:hypothetical protein